MVVVLNCSYSFLNTIVLFVGIVLTTDVLPFLIKASKESGSAYVSEGGTYSYNAFGYDGNNSSSKPQEVEEKTSSEKCQPING